MTKPPGNDPKRQRCFVVVSRPALIDSRFSTVICAPIYTTHVGSLTETQLAALRTALLIALDLDAED